MKVKVDVVEFEADLNELLTIAEILKKRLRRKHRRALKELLEEIEKIYTVIVDAVNDFLKIHYGDPQFAKSFAEKRAAFDKQNKMDSKSVGFSCDKVKKKLDTLTGPSLMKRFVSKITGKEIREEEYLDESRLRLKNHIDSWYVHDKQVYQKLQQLQSRLLAGLDEINDILRTKGPEEADKDLQSFIKESQKEFDRIKELKEKLHYLSEEL
jgi:hypothetical protein